MSASDAAILLGMVLLLFAIGGLYIDTATVKMRNLPGADSDAGRVIRRVYQPRTIAPAQAVAAQPLPTLAPFDPNAQTAVPEAGGNPAVADLPQAGDPPEVTAMPDVGAAPEEAAALDAPVENNSFLAAGAPPPTAVPLPQALAPQRIVIPAIQLDAPVLPSGYQLLDINGQVYQQWEAPMEYAAGWQQTSAFLGVPGNTVLNGHHNIYGSVFGRLIDLNEGDVIEIHSGDWVILYTVANKMILPERGEDLSVRLENGRWMQSTDDERLTLVTCWPPESNTHRLFIVAQPVDKRLASSRQGP